MRDTGIEGPQESVYKNSTSHVLDDECSIRVTLVLDRRGRKIRISHQPIYMVLDDLEPSHTVRFGGRTESNINLDIFSILASYFL